MNKLQIKQFLVKEIIRLRKDLHNFEKPTFREGYDKGMHAGFMDLLNKIDPQALKSIPGPIPGTTLSKSKK